MAVAIQPCADKKAKSNFIQTVETPVSLNLISEYVDPDIVQQIQKYNKEGAIPVWGVLSRNQKRWQHLITGDIILFYRSNHVFAYARVIGKCDNAALAEKLWGYDLTTGETWQYIYFIDKLNSISIHKSSLNHIAGYKDNYSLRGFQICNSLASNNLINYFELDKNWFIHGVTQDDYESAILASVDKTRLNRLSQYGSLDRVSNTTSRVEQSYLRDLLFKDNKEAICGICGSLVPVELLVTAHIKKRSQCTIEERLDAKYIVMPMCKIHGCDDLYERGFIYVTEGIIHTDCRGYASDALINTLSCLEGKQCSFFNEHTESYFNYHCDHR